MLRLLSFWVALPGRAMTNPATTAPTTELPVDRGGTLTKHEGIDPGNAEHLRLRGIL